MSPSAVFQRQPWFAYARYRINALYHVWIGDQELGIIRRPYRKRLLGLFALMMADTAVSMYVPFVGQKLYDTAAQGAAPDHALASMISATGFLLAFETLDPLRRAIQFSLARTMAQFTAKARLRLLHRHAAAPGLIYLHAPALAIRNVEIPLKLPQVVIHGLVSAFLLWRLDPVVAAVSGATAAALALWSRRWSAPLSETARRLRNAEDGALRRIRAYERGEVPGPALRSAMRRVRTLEIRQAAQQQWFQGIVDRVGTLVLMTGVMLWGAWHQFIFGRPTTGEILAVLALAWHVQFKITALFEIVKKRYETDAAARALLRAE